MSHLKKEIVDKCLSLLREYIDETSLSSKKESAILALNQLQKITAGTNDLTLELGCTCKPRAAEPLVTLSCTCKPRIVG